MKIRKRAVAAAITFSLMAAPITPVAQAQTPSVSTTTEAAELIGMLAQILPANNKQITQALTALALVIAGIAVVAPLVEAGSSIRNGTAVSQGVKTRRITVAGKTRSYDVVLPAGHSADKSYPVIIGFGGWQHDAARTRDYERFETATDGAIVIYAQGVDNAWAGAPYAKTSIDEDIAYVRALIDDASQTFGADPDRVAVAGLSNGGGFAAALACHAPETITAAAAVAGAYYSPTVTGCESGAVPVLLMHGTNDDIVGYDGGFRHGASFEAVKDVFGTLGRKNGCVMLPRESRTGNVTTIEPLNCDTETRLQRIEGGGHTWFTNPSATAETARFLLQYL